VYVCRPGGGREGLSGCGGLRVQQSVERMAMLAKDGKRGEGKDIRSTVRLQPRGTLGRRGWFCGYKRTWRSTLGCRLHTRERLLNSCRIRE
jgi:hypothetical protein